MAYTRGDVHKLAPFVVALAAIAALIAAAIAYSRFGGFGTGPSADADEFARYATPVSQVAIPEGTRVVALGEATRGSREFHRLKLDVFKVMVEQFGARAFALEGDFGGCVAVNRYIHGGEGTAEEAAAAIGLAAYRTKEMAELISWMREYNQTAAPGQDLRFYGFDMQRCEYAYRYLVEESQALGLDATELEKLEKLWDGEGYSDAYSPEQRRNVLVDVAFSLLDMQDEKDVGLALRLADCLINIIDLDEAASSPDASGRRDSYMAQYVLWALGQEEERGNELVFIAGRNGHIEREGSYGRIQKVMGNILADSLGDAYFAIGTDFFEAAVDLADGDGRMTHTFYSYDPLAKAADACGYQSCWLDFSLVPEGSSLTEFIDGPITMGSVGESFSPLMLVLPQSYRIEREPSSTYDGIILVAHAHPTETAAPAR